MSLKSRDVNTRRRLYDNEDFCRYDPDDVMNDVHGSSDLAGKYALYWPRPGKNVYNPATAQAGDDTDADEEEMDESGSSNEAVVVSSCPGPAVASCCESAGRSEPRDSGFSEAAVRLEAEK